MHVKAVECIPAAPGLIRWVAEVGFEESRLPAEHLWFDLPEAIAAGAPRAGNPWLLALLPLAFELGERLRLPLPVDPVLRRNAGEIMRIWSRWFPSRRPILIEADLESATSVPGAGRTGLFFTGGVDSFFTALHFDHETHTGALPGQRAIDDLIYVQGFDIPLHHRDALARKQARLAEIAGHLGKTLITVATNLRSTSLRRLDWAQRVHGCALGAVALLFESRFRTVLISASTTYDRLHPWGSHTLVDPRMSTGATVFVHYGAGYGRFAKTAALAGSKIALQHLHVCWRQGAETNCGVCEKCCRTQLALELLGVRSQAGSFPAGAFSPRRLRAVRIDGEVAPRQLLELEEEARRRGRPDLAEEIARCLDRQARLDRFEQALRFVEPLPLVGSLARRWRRRLRRRWRIHP